MSCLKLSAAFPLAMILLFCSCERNTEQKEAQKQNPTVQQGPDIAPASDPLEQFFHSKGVLEYKYPERSYQILNEDNTVFASINFRTEQIKLGNQKYWLKDFLQDSALLNRFQFFPRDVFYPDYSVINFEYTDVKDGVADVYLNKEKNVKKRIRLSDSAFRVEPWKEHFMGSMVNFDEKTNLIRVSPDDNAKPLGYENYKGDYIIHTISEISGDWIKIHCKEGACGYPCKQGTKYDGWIRWKKGNKMLIDFAYVC